jgi:chromosome partitioning protein
VSRFLKAARTAESIQAAARVDWGHEPRPFKVISVTSNKGGVGKTTLACNLAVYLRAMREDLPILILTLDDQLVLDRMFSTDGRASEHNLLDAIRSGDLLSAIKLGQFGIHYVSASPDAAKLKTTTTDLFHLQRVFERTGWEGLVIIDTKSDFEILTQNAIMASDLVMVAVKDFTSLLEAERVFDLLESMNRPKETARIVLSLMDLRVKFGTGPANVLELLVSEVRKRGYPLFESFVSRSAKVEALQTNPEERVHSIMHGASKSVTHRQMTLLAQEVLGILDPSQPPAQETARRIEQPIGQSTVLRVEESKRPGLMAS